MGAAAVTSKTGSSGGSKPPGSSGAAAAAIAPKAAAAAAAKGSAAGGSQPPPPTGAEDEEAAAARKRLEVDRSHLVREFRQLSGRFDRRLAGLRAARLELLCDLSGFVARQLVCFQELLLLKVRWFAR